VPVVNYKSIRGLVRGSRGGRGGDKNRERISSGDNITKYQASHNYNRSNIAYKS